MLTVNIGIEVSKNRTGAPKALTAMCDGEGRRIFMVGLGEREDEQGQGAK